jgi:hypothetical protein
MPVVLEEWGRRCGWVGEVEGDAAALLVPAAEGILRIFYGTFDVLIDDATGPLAWRGGAHRHPHRTDDHGPGVDREGGASQR